MDCNTGSSQITTPKKVNFARLSRVVIDLFAKILRDILLFYYPHSDDLRQKIRDIQLEEKLWKDMAKITDGDGYEKCDVSLLYTLLRNTCQIEPPTITERRKIVWGGDKIPSRECTSLGDDIERIRIIRNKVCSHVHSTEIEDGDCEKYFGISLGICKRLSGKFGRLDYVKELETLKICRMEADSLVALTDKMTENIESNEALRDYVREESRKVHNKLDKLYQVVTQLKGPSAGELINRDRKGNIQCITENGLDIMKRIITEPENEDVKGKSRHIIDAVIIDTCGRRDGINLQLLETRFNDLFHSSFRKTVGLKMLEYLRKSTDKFTIYQNKSKQWNVKLVKNTSSIKKKRNKKQDYAMALNRNATDEDVDVSPTGLLKDTEPSTRVNKNYPENFEAFQIYENPCHIRYDKHRDTEKSASHLDMESKGENESLSPISDAIAQSISEFLEKVHNFEKSSESFALVVAKTDIMPNIDSLALIPWLCVFDFDMNSREDGLYSVLEGHIKTVHPCTLKDRPRFSFSYTYWCQLRGNCQIPDTCIDCDARLWINKIKVNLEEHLETLAEYISNNSKLKVVLLWPKEREDIKFVVKFMMQLDAAILPDIFVIHPEMLEEPASLGQIESTYKLKVPYESFYSYLKTHLRKVKPRTSARYTLPTFDGCNNPGIDEFTASHLQEDLNILYMKGDEECSFDVCDIKEEGKNFLRGGTLRWFVYYECDEGGYFDVKRDIMNKILSDIRRFHIKRSLSGILEVFHTPGAGGTTLSQRILWELHTEIPCVQVKSNIQSTTFDIVQHVKLLFEKTQLPILVLLDGRDDSEVKYFYNQCGLQSISVIVLHVQRFRKEPKDANLIRGKYWIKSQVSPREAKQFCIRYLEFCDTEEKKENLQTITENVTKGELHQVYEFGLTTFAHEYKGVEAYVRGYLHLVPDTELNSTQKLLGYLSLVYFYGQMSLPCELFSKLLQKNNGIAFEDLPFEVHQLVVKSDNHQHRGFIRICHQIVAKEILEQILGRNITVPHKSSSQNLSQEACRNLVHFAHEFIKEMKRKFDKKIHWKKNIIVEIFNKIFLNRDTHDIDEYSLQKPRPRFSRFFTDIEKCSTKQDRIEIMQIIVSCCAENPNYHAHLGRMYTLYYPGEETTMAEKHFKEAISICEKEQNRGKKISNLCPEDHSSNASIYHMYGMHFYHRLCTITRDSIEKNFEKDIYIVLEYAQNACLNFETSRENSYPGIGQSYGLVGEIMIRTEVCNYINKHMNMRLSEYIRSPMSPVVVFVRESMVQIFELITQCYSTLDRDELPPTMSKQISLYKELFNEVDLAELCSPEGPLDYTKRRHKVTQIKLKYGKLERYDIFSLDKRTPSKDILEIVKHLEDNFMELEITGHLGCSTGLVESDYKDWINAIRLNQYNRTTRLEEVYRKIHQWHEVVHTPISKFYVFIVCAAMTILDNDVSHFIEATEMLEEVKKYKYHFHRPSKPREWFGNSTGVKCLIPSYFIKPIPDSGVDEIEIKNEFSPKILKGTISGANKRTLWGTISLNVCNGSQFEVFFAPVRTKEKLVGPMYANQRVEFVLCFNVSHGFMAYNVKRLETIQCDQCSRKVEFTTGQCIANCKCGSLVKKLKAEEPFFHGFS
uniref:Uncharacterized protein LOC111122363 n=1 Tax=Crassostrea virginica TaxID=6565 RepID=A0A8B8CVZ2_CRAVI|nr:uncharacterized protein LOC111122363 [Crassostrea virginica]XP_022319816.1 uncharacterized protein LOC111122363 [Crassostrea virginica]XP_022319817.1 uncharacterized protein LOC111122363 [Crassostrea virginica]